MLDNDRLRLVVREWIGKAEADFQAATFLVKLGKKCPTEAACFHAQQCAEKYLKALLVSAGADFPKTHDLDRLIQLLPRTTPPLLAPAESAELAVHAVAGRYPGSESVSLRDARRAVSLARKVRRSARALFPLSAKRRVRS